MRRARRPRDPVPGAEDVVAGIDFLKEMNFGKPKHLKDKKVVVIGAGNVGMDIASQAYNHGAASVTAVDIQKPAAFGKEMEMAKEKGTQILWPKVTERYDKKEKKLYFKDGTSLDADLVIISIGEMPVLDFLPPDINTERGWINGERSGPDLGREGLCHRRRDQAGPRDPCHRPGPGRRGRDPFPAHAHRLRARRETGRSPTRRSRPNTTRSAGSKDFDAKKEADRCMSCATCRDCGMCEETCY